MRSQRSRRGASCGASSCWASPPRASTPCTPQRGTPRYMLNARLFDSAAYVTQLCLLMLDYLSTPGLVASPPSTIQRLQTA
jgi:hypothetical protein